ncbi:hypothetical protein IWQ55_006591 [Labrenzia sp. EL_208]|nr:hypothetical protein [Labrenzia sp. EL_132]MBG6209767.1 hypothetical protein [Labrenzia sp. EL_126]MBG6233349.1 hypothetical protein [Labrenzia sp. EL_208]
MEFETTHEWQGFTIKKGEQDKFWVSEKPLTNPMPGACCFGSVEAAQKGIAALQIARSISTDEQQIGDLFWNLMELTK